MDNLAQEFAVSLYQARAERIEKLTDADLINHGIRAACADAQMRITAAIANCPDAEQEPSRSWRRGAAGVAMDQKQGAKIW